jgi:hypothetical protein
VRRNAVGSFDRAEGLGRAVFSESSTVDRNVKFRGPGDAEVLRYTVFPQKLQWKALEHST